MQAMADASFCTTCHIHTAPSLDHSSVSPHQPGAVSEADVKALCGLRTSTSFSSCPPPQLLCEKPQI